MLNSSARIWSLLDMLKDNAADFVTMGQRMAASKMLFVIQREKKKDESGRFVLTERGVGYLRNNLVEMKKLAERLALPTTTRIIGRRLDESESLPKTMEEFSLILEVMQDELASKLFLFVPTERASFWEKSDLLSDKAKAAFPKAAAELRSAGNAYAAALPEGAIFYSMRAVEHGLRALATDVGKVFDVQQWKNIIDEIEAQITAWSSNGIPGTKKADKDDRLNFLSGAAKEFVYFKEGWRNYVAHAKVPYSEYQALTVINHVAHFVERLSERLSEAA